MLRLAVALMLALGQVVATTNLTWSPCPLLSSPIKNKNLMVQCATYAAPLCHAGVCEMPSSANATVDVLVRRIPAMLDRLKLPLLDPEDAPSMWVLQGAKNYTVDSVENVMMSIFNALEAKVNIYTMDHRGSGRGTILTCEQARAATSWWPLSFVDPANVPECAQELEGKYGDLAAFSTTSAAMDLVTFISKYGNDVSTTLYGRGYGTLVVERAIHLDPPPNVRGYVFDSVLPIADLDKVYSATATAGTGEAADAFFGLCATDSECRHRFKKKGLKASVQHLVTRFDNHPKSTCAKLLKKYLKVSLDDDSPSIELRALLAKLSGVFITSVLVPPVIYRLLRCTEKDVAVLTHFLQLFKAIRDSEDGPTVHLLEGLITASELWTTPTPSADAMKTRLHKALVTPDLMYREVPSYCAYSKEKSPTCNKLKVGNYEGNGIIYKRDEYWNMAAKVPDQASVLIISTKQDMVNPTSYAEAFLGGLDTEKKELVTFQYYLPGDDEVTGGDCGASIVASFVHGDGDLSRVDKSCMDNEAPFNWTVSLDLTKLYLGTNDAYDGVFDPSVFQSSDGSSASISGDGSD